MKTLEQMGRARRSYNVFYEADEPYSVDREAVLEATQIGLVVLSKITGTLGVDGAHRFRGAPEEGDTARNMPWRSFGHRAVIYTGRNLECRVPGRPAHYAHGLHYPAVDQTNSQIYVSTRKLDGASLNTLELARVFVHEGGHEFGLDHCTDLDCIMLDGRTAREQSISLELKEPEPFCDPCADNLYEAK